MAYDTDYANSLLPDFQQRVTVGLLNAAVNIMSESAGTTGHAARTNFAKQVLSNPVSFAPDCALAVVSDDVTTPAVTDAQLQARINSLWNAWAGVINS